MTTFLRRAKGMTPVWLAWAAALAITAGVSAQVPPSPVVPALACEVLSGGDASSGGQPVRVSNLKRVLMRATLVAPETSVDGLRLAGAGRDGSPATLDVTVRRTTTAARPRVEAKTFVTGHGFEPGRQYVDLSLEVPVDRAARRAQIQRYLDRLGQSSARAGKSDEFKRLTQDRETAFAAFERMYVENVVGDFEVTCSYSARGSGVWNGTIESSPPIKLHVFFESAFFDQPAFR